MTKHDCIDFRGGTARISEWQFSVDGGTRRILPDAKVTYNDPELVLEAVLGGQGLAQMPGNLADGHARGTLVSCLETCAIADQGHYIRYQSRQHMPTRMRVSIDFMTDRIRSPYGAAT